MKLTPAAMLESSYHHGRLLRKEEMIANCERVRNISEDEPSKFVGRRNADASPTQYTYVPMSGAMTSADRHSPASDVESDWFISTVLTVFSAVVVYLGFLRYQMFSLDIDSSP
ncbi:hypothetical protein KIN20_032822 [Parelaphostrongylus tenuis]|uniref:Uncharacterized protein n=1 Tax=Parelaphostrongylus tenuis TaxID=148309 RepID=A0AAD5WHR7_PARTN|nr:hypothetical protein KIN20_032822 [Parelaphostrongylus tenuis]